MFADDLNGVGIITAFKFHAATHVVLAIEEVQIIIRHSDTPVGAKGATTYPFESISPKARVRLLDGPRRGERQGQGGRERRDFCDLGVA